MLQQWWQNLLVWLGISQPGTRKEQVENWIENHGPELVNFYARQVARKNARGHFFQRLRGWAKPTDDSFDNETNDFAGKLPVWADVSIDVWEAPVVGGGSEKGYTLNLWVTEADLTVWTLRLDSKAGSLGWSQIVPPAI